MYIVITENEVIITKQDYPSFREIQSDYVDFVASLGPWLPDEIIDFLEFEYPNSARSIKEQVDELLNLSSLKLLYKGLTSTNKATPGSLFCYV